MDQFPPDNSHDENGSRIFKRLCAETLIDSQEEEVQLVAGPSRLPKYVKFTFFLIPDSHAISRLTAEPSAIVSSASDNLNEMFVYSFLMHHVILIFWPVCSSIPVFLSQKGIYSV